QAEDGIRDRNVTGVQTCALPISRPTPPPPPPRSPSSPEAEAAARWGSRGPSPCGGTGRSPTRPGRGRGRPPREAPPAGPSIAEPDAHVASRLQDVRVERHLLHPTVTDGLGQRHRRDLPWIEGHHRPEAPLGQ